MMIIFFVNEQLLNYVEYHLSRKLGNHIIRINSCMNEDFKLFCENAMDLYEKSQTNGSEFLQHEERLTELEEKYKEFRVTVLKDTVNVYEKIIRRKLKKLHQQFTVVQLLETNIT